MPKGIYERKGKPHPHKGHKGVRTNKGFTGRKHSEKTIKKMSKSQKRIGNKPPSGLGKANSNWKGGRRKHSDGYILIYKPSHPFCNSGRYIFEHRLVIEKILGRYLHPKEKVHHLNEKQDDNQPENLMAFINNTIHKRFHKDPQSVKLSEIIFDGRKIKSIK